MRRKNRLSFMMRRGASMRLTTQFAPLPPLPPTERRRAELEDSGRPPYPTSSDEVGRI